MVSLTRSGASESVVQKIATEKETLLYDGITTREIYKNIIKKLESFIKMAKQAIPGMELYMLQKFQTQ